MHVCRLTACSLSKLVSCCPFTSSPAVTLLRSAAAGPGAPSAYTICALKLPFTRFTRQLRLNMSQPALPRHPQPLASSLHNTALRAAPQRVNTFARHQDVLPPAHKLFSSAGPTDLSSPACRAVSTQAARSSAPVLADESSSTPGAAKKRRAASRKAATVEASPEHPTQQPDHSPPLTQATPSKPSKRGRPRSASLASQATAGHSLSLEVSPPPASQQLAPTNGLSTVAAPPAARKKAAPKSRSRSVVKPSTPSPAPVLAPAPQQQVMTFEDLLRDVPPAGHPAHTLRHWVVFSDLHVQEKSLATCMQVVDRVLQEAKARGAGVLFLGDWWHERGSVAFKLLNTCRDKLVEFDKAGIPMLMLVGNHDQVDIHGEQHGLTCLATPMIHVFTHATVFRNTLWLPYRRHEDVLLEAKDLACEHYKSAGQKLSAIFAHADVATARYNATYQAQDGIAPDHFPSGVPVYTGHYHMPHTVPNTTIQYVGSPYQVSASEINQEKRLLMLDADQHWAITEEIPISYGVKHVNLRSSMKLSDVDLSVVGPHTVVRLQVDREHLNTPEHKQLTEELAARGAVVQSSLTIAPSGPRLEVRQDSQPEELLQQYRAARSKELSEAGLAVAVAAIKDAAGLRSSSARGSGQADLVFDNIAFEGFGPFKEYTEYPLAKRGLRVITGRNEDDAGGSGKSTLVSAALWALTGEMTTRTESGVGKAGGAVDSMLHDGCKSAAVRLSGKLDGQPFLVERAIKKGATSRLYFSLDGEDLTAQDKKATADRISRAMCTSLLRHQAFVGQNDVQTLLEANDAESKQLLSQVVEMEIWDTALELIKPKEGQVKKSLAAMESRVKAREEDVEQLKKQLETAAKNHDTWQQKQDKELAKLAGQEEQLRTSAGSSAERMVSLAPELVTAWEVTLAHLHHVKQQYETAMKQGAEPVPPLELPPAPRLEETRLQLLSEQAQAATVAVDAVEGSQAQAGAGDDLGDLEAKIQALQQDDEQVTAQEAVRLEELQAKLSDAELDQTQADRQHETCKKEVQQFDDQIQRRQRQVVDLQPGSVCEACGQEVDVEHVKMHILELQEGRATAIEALSDAKTRLKACQRARKAVQGELKQLQESRMDEARERSQQIQDLMQRKSNLMARQRDALKREQQAQSAADKQLREAHAKAEKQHSKLVAKLQAAHSKQVQAAQDAFQQRLQEVTKLREELSSCVGEVDKAWDSLVACYEVVRDENLGSELLALPSKPSGRATATSASLPDGDVDACLETLEQLTGEVESVVDQVMVEVKRLQQVVSKVEEMKKAQNPHAEEKRIYAEQLAARQVELQALTQQVVDLERELVTLKEAAKALGREGIQSFVLERVLAQLQEESNLYLSQLSDTLRLELRATRVTGGAKAKAAADSAASGKKRSRKSSPSPADDDVSSSSESEGHKAGGKPVVEREQVTKVVWYQHPDGSQPIERHPSQLSGGERRRVALALLFGFAKLLRDTGRLRCNLMVLDEGLQQLDSDGCRRVFEVLRQEPYETLLVVAQANSFVTLQEYDGMDTVVKRRGEARLEVQAE